MRLRAGLAVSVSLAALLALPATGLCQDPGKGGPGGPGGATPPKSKEEPAPLPEAPKEQVDTQVEVKGSRFRIKLNHGPQIEGILPQGIYWEKLDPMTGEYEEAAETDKMAGLRLSYVLGMEGDVFLMKSTIKEIRDLGALTDEQKRAIRDQVIADRKQKITDREKALREEMSKMKVREKEEAKKTEDTSKGDAAKGEKKAEGASDDEAKKGDALLEKFPPEDWSEARMKQILQRKYTMGVYPSEEEKEFIENFKIWKAALDRKEAASEKKGEKKEEEGKKETPPTGGGK